MAERIFAKKEFEAKRFGPARWTSGGEAYTTVEDSLGVEGAKDIVRYDTASGEREVLVPAARLQPDGAEQALEIDDYAWSKDGSRLLVFTNTEKVWRRNTRGDYWVLELDTGALRQLGGTAAASTLMFARLSPDGTRAAYVRENDLWVEELASGELIRLTADGSDTSINGTSDGSTRRSSTSATPSAGAPTAARSPSGTSTPAAWVGFPSSTTRTRLIRW